MLPLSRRLLMTGAAATAAAWGLPALAEPLPRSRPPTSRALLSNLLVTVPPSYSTHASDSELPIGHAVYHNYSHLFDGGYHHALRIHVDFHRYSIEVPWLAFYSDWYTLGGNAPRVIPGGYFDAKAEPWSRRWIWRPTLANTQGLTTLQFPGSKHQSIFLLADAGAINLVNVDSLFGDIDVAQIV